jgi:hypothetical protein
LTKLSDIIYLRGLLISINNNENGINKASDDSHLFVMHFNNLINVYRYKHFAIPQKTQKSGKTFGKAVKRKYDIGSVM